jgi:hypothetical protein
MNYYNLPEVSNSDLLALARAFNALPDNRAELEDIFNFGSLVDAMLSEDHKVLHSERALLQDGPKLIYTPDVWEQADALAIGCKKDPVISLIIKQMIGQYIFVRSLGFTHEDENYSIRARCKFDGFSKALQMGADYKTTSCKTKKQFRDAIDFFRWDQQGAFYMDLARIDQHWIIGISKHTGEIFKHVIERGDPVHLSGQKKI